MEAKCKDLKLTNKNYPTKKALSFENALYDLKLKISCFQSIFWHLQMLRAKV